VSAPAVLLWDIDGTLIATQGEDERRYGAVLRDLLGDPDVRTPANTSGLTDHGIVRDALLDHGLSEEQAALLVPVALEAMEVVTAQESADGIPLLAGVRELLERPWPADVIQTAGTGNARRRARIKLDAAGLTDLFDLGVGGFGDLPADRWRILEESVERVELLRGGPVDRSRVVVIGDTPRDVAAAQRAGLRSVGVATGHHPVPELEEAGADLVVADLGSGGEAVAAFVEGVLDSGA
jgi:phosphoglycolate phosphatase